MLPGCSWNFSIFCGNVCVVGVGVGGGEGGGGCGEEGHPKKLVVPLPHYFLLLFPLQSCRYLPT